ncbi:hypothetical protein [Nocardia gipuzkoensis]
MSRTATLLVSGLVLLCLFIAVGRSVQGVGVRRAAEDFTLVWLALTIGNMAAGVIDEGYGVREEIPYLLTMFVPPAAIATIAWWLTFRKTKQMPSANP